MTGTVTSPIDSATRQYRDATRLLFVLAEAGVSDLEPGAPDDAVLEVSSQVRLQKLDFWVRSPDYLADELLNLYLKVRDGRYLDLCRAILDGTEPEIRRDDMVRHLYGAYEPLDTSFSILVTCGLAAERRHRPTRRRSFYLLERGLTAADRLVAAVPELKWYQDRAVLVAEVAGPDSGTELRDRQYDQPGYGSTPRRHQIASIAPAVRERLTRIEANQ